MSKITKYSIHDLGTIATVIGNATSHCFPHGAIVICVPQDGFEEINPTGNTYGYCEESSTGQYLSAQCIRPIGAISALPADVNKDVYLKALAAWKMNPTSFVNKFYSHAARTQKARGLQVLTQFRFNTLPIQLIRSTHDLEEYLPQVQFPIMVRPCPTKPRHGFVESRVAKTKRLIKKVLHETLAADPRGELLLMPPIYAEWSSIVTENAITIGRGTDGATSGKKCVNIPCASNMAYQLQLASKDTATNIIQIQNKHGRAISVDSKKYVGIVKEANIFVETVGPHCVQLRTGPQFDSSHRRYSTRERVAVAHVLEVNPTWSFLDYEQKLHALRETYTDFLPAVLVYQANAALTSHFMVQAIANGFSVVTDGPKPAVGDVLTFTRPFMTFPDPRHVAFCDGLERATAYGYQLTPSHQTLHWAIAIIQGMGPMAKTQASVDLLIAASIVIAKAGIAVCIGEYRHFYRSGPGRDGYLATAPVRFPHTDVKWYVTKNDMSRSVIYEAAFQEDWSQFERWTEYHSLLYRVKRDFCRSSWAPGYGGAAWGNCTEATLDILYALMPFLILSRNRAAKLSSSIGESYLLQLVGACNRLITVSHNSGKCLTKLISAGVLNAISEGHTGLHLATSSLTWELVKHYVKA